MRFDKDAVRRSRLPVASTTCRPSCVAYLVASAAHLLSIIAGRPPQRTDQRTCLGRLDVPPPSSREVRREVVVALPADAEKNSAASVVRQLEEASYRYGRYADQARRPPE